MKQGTWSVLLGCHSPVHSIIVLISWRRCYSSWPSGWQIVCILLHDIGHWGKDYLDNYNEKVQHAELGAKVAGRLFGQKGSDLINGHCSYSGQERSKLYVPDKYSWVIAPVWWMITNTWFEPKLQRRGSSRVESVKMFKEAMIANQKTDWQEQGHDIYLRQWGQGKDGG